MTDLLEFSFVEVRVQSGFKLGEGEIDSAGDGAESDLIRFSDVDNQDILRGRQATIQTRHLVNL